MDLGLKGKHVLITGGSKGIGLACAQAFRSEGARVAIVSRSQANLDAAKKLSHGLAGMTHRVRSFNGTLDVHSPSGKGTRVEMFVPLALVAAKPTPG